MRCVQTFVQKSEPVDSAARRDTAHRDEPLPWDIVPVEIPKADEDEAPAPKRRCEGEGETGTAAPVKPEASHDFVAGGGSAHGERKSSYTERRAAERAAERAPGTSGTRHRNAAYARYKAKMGEGDRPWQNKWS